MVEFGLKLQDNQVAEWSEYYLNYEKLKQILSKCAAAVARYDALAARKPEIAARVKQDVQAGLPTPQPSTDNLAAAKRFVSPSSTSHGVSQHSDKSSAAGIEITSPTEETPLPTPTGVAAAGTTTDYGSTTESTSLQRSSSSSALTRALKSATSGMTDYFQRSYERQVRDALHDIDKHSKQFETALTQDIEHVNTFYNDKLKELTDRLAFLKESVSVLRAAWGDSPPAPPPTIHEEEEHDEEAELAGGTESYNLETPLIRKPRKTYRTSVQAFAHNIARRLSTMAIEDAHPRRVSQGPVLSSWGHDDDDDVHESTFNEQDRQRSKEIQSIQRALVDLYRTAKLLHNFAIMNYTGFVKICKKHDKILKDEKGKYKQAIQPLNICQDSGKSVEVLANQMERLYANWFCDRNVSEAQAQMLPKKGDGLEMDWSQMRLGYRMGMCSILGLWVCWDCIWGLVSHGQTTIGGRTAFPVFRACGGLLILQWCWGCSVWVWTRYRINYIYIMDLDPNTVQSPLAIFNVAVDDTLVYLVCTLLYYKAGAHDLPGHFPAGIFPALVVFYTVYRLLFPLKTRLPMWNTIWKVISTPLYSPTFFQNYVGDIFTSLVKVFQDLAWTVFFLLSGDWLISEDSKLSTKHVWSRATWYSKILIPLLTLLPLWFRFNQCLRRYHDTGDRFPHLANALKYALSQTVTLFGAFYPLYMQGRTGTSVMFQLFWMGAFVGSSLYSFTWDVYMDWGLGRPKYKFLGPRLMFPHRSAYYATIAVDLVLRFAWVLTLVPPQSGAKFALPAYLTAVSMMLELFRRTVWGFLRLENEHRSNTAGYRRVDFVPLHFNTGHAHGYKQEKEHRGSSVLLEVIVVTLLVLAAAVVSVIAGQRATERINAAESEL